MRLGAWWGFLGGLSSRESEAQRRSVGMSERETGVLVTDIDYGASAWNMIELGDVVLVS